MFENKTLLFYLVGLDIIIVDSQSTVFQLLYVLVTNKEKIDSQFLSMPSASQKTLTMCVGVMAPHYATIPTNIVRAN